MIPRRDEEFAKAWHACGYENSPVGHAQRSLRRDVLARFHSFSDRRYPDNPEDEMQVFNRFCAISDEVFSGGERIYYLNYWFMDAELPDEEHITMWSARPVVWNPIEWRQLLLTTAYDQALSFGLFAPRSGWFISPYDGGLDVFSKDAASRDTLAEKFRRWLSSHPEGL